MVFNLVFDVLNHNADLGLAHAKRPVSGLPFKLSMIGDILANPRIGHSFEFLDPFRERDRSPQACQDMHMIFDSPNTNYRTVEAIGNLAELGVELVPQGDILEYGKAVLRREDQVDANR